MSAREEKHNLKDFFDAMLLLLIVLLPFVAAALTPWLARWCERRIGWWAAAVSGAASGMLLSLSAPIQSGQGVAWRMEWPAVELGLRLSLFADGWGWTFALLVTCIGTLICVYAQYYLGAREARARFFSHLLMFEGAMLGIVLSENLIVLVIFWELTSISSFLLIGFWHEEEKARYGAYKALLITALGGLALLAAAVLLYLVAGTFEIRELFALRAEILSHPWFTIILALVLLGAFTKSAQFPFHFWLPDAMSAPTPVSAYLHSATMVKAGVFLLGRLQPIFRESNWWLWTVSLVGLTTMLLGAWAAVRKHDLKALLAYSTVSQLGLITMLYGFGTELGSLAASFHIFNHAMFKAGLFLVIGIVDHETGTRDLRLLSGLGRWMPRTAVLCGACALASAGVPLFNGFLSKELFYEELVARGAHGAVWAVWPWLAVGGGVLTFVYSIQIFHGVFFGPPKELKKIPEPRPRGHDPSWGLLGPVALLAILCVKVGLWPGMVEHALMRPAVWAIWQGQFDFHIVLLHGWSTPLLLSILTLVGGLVVYSQRHHLTAVQKRLEFSFTATTIYDSCVSGLVHGAQRLTDALQNGKLRSYFWIVTLFLLGVIGWNYGQTTGRPWPSQWTEAGIGETILIILLVTASVGVVLLQNLRLPAVIVLGGVGYLISVLFLVLSAPDLALTQLLVESVVMILFLLVLWYLPKEKTRVSTLGQKRSDAILAILFGAAMTLVVLGVFSAESPAPRLTDYYATHTLEKTGGRNMVNVILVDYRGLDTLGEITVLAIAALGGYALVRIRRAQGGQR